ncbi:hypothetical protein OC861_006506 [Tilletia horrida]|nr:hypothetical protein OC861_006506 [Tilletia horrida]
MSWKRGINDPATPHRLVLDDDERITSVIITAGNETDTPGLESILALKLVTNDGNSLQVEEKQSKRTGYGRRLIAGRPFYDIRSVTFGSPLERGYAIGFWGRSQETGNPLGIFRLGVVWCNTHAVDTKPEEDKKQVEARDKDATKEIKIDDLDKVLREYKELLEDHSRLQQAKLLVDKELVEEKEKHERDTTEMKNRNERSLSSLTAEHEKRVKELEGRLGELEKTDQAKMVTTYRTLTDCAGWAYLKHKSGNVLTFVSVDKRAVLKPQGNNWDNWQQRKKKDWFPTLTAGQLGWNSYGSTMAVEPVAGEKEWYYLKNFNTYLGTEGRSMAADATIVAHTNTPGPSDQWQLIRYDPTADWEKHTNDRTLLLYRLLRDTGKFVFLEHKSGMVLDCHDTEFRPILGNKTGLWMQRFYFASTENPPGFTLFCKEVSGTSRYLTTETGASGMVFRSTNNWFTFNIEPVGDTPEYFYLCFTNGQVLGPKDGKQDFKTELIWKDRTAADQWRFVYGQQ